MGNNYTQRFILAFITFVLLTGMYSCANMASPNGGPYDEKPPKFIRSTPAPNETNFKGKKIEIEFDELVQLEKPMENVIVTPPQQQLPVIRSAGKKVIVQLKDTLKENTTYTIDFTNSIADNNEKNVFENFSFAFSTGNEIDSLEISGVLLNAQNLEPMPGITIGLHADLNDSAFVKLPFNRTSRTNDKGQFTIRNIATGTYRMFALNDLNRDYKFDQAGEDIAFMDSVVIPSFEFSTRQDTIWKDSLTVDTIKTVNYTRFIPDDIQLRLFKEDFVRQYILKPERVQENRFTLKFNAPLDTIPFPKPLNFDVKDDNWFFVQEADANKTVHYWLTDSTIWQQDTLMVAVTYPKSDSLNILRPQVDTLQLTMRRRPEPKKKRKKDEPEPIVFLGMSVDAPGKMEIYDTVSVTFDEPLLDIKKEMFNLEIKVDTLWEKTDFDFFRDSLNTLSYNIERKWNYGETFRLTVDSAAIQSLYGKWNNKYSGEFSIKRQDEYGNLFLEISGIDTPAFVDLLDRSDNVIRRAPVTDGGALFMDLKPDKYYARIVQDTNNNNKWDTGNYAKKLQPEEVFYYPNVIEILVNFDITQNWDVKSTPLQKQKPLDITKNKPKEDAKKKRDYKNEGRQSESSGSSMRLPGL